ncbi:hypothetical protein Tco_1099841 [Tanacetum coccineum]
MNSRCWFHLYYVLDRRAQLDDRHVSHLAFDGSDRMVGETVVSPSIPSPPFLPFLGKWALVFGYRTYFTVSRSMHPKDGSSTAMSPRLGDMMTYSYDRPGPHILLYLKIPNYIRLLPQDHTLTLTPESNRGIRSHDKVNGVYFLVQGPSTNSLGTRTRMSAMANATPPIVTIVTKTTNKEKAPDAAPGVNIVDFCEEYYEDILPIIMDKARRDKRKEVLKYEGVLCKVVDSLRIEAAKAVELKGLWVELNVDDKGDMEKHDLNT